MMLEYPEHGEHLKDAFGRYRTQSLFHEFFGTKQPQQPLWTLKESCSKGLPSLRLLYLEVADPTEYLFAQRAFGSWKHWLKVKKNKLIYQFIQEWELELEVKLRSHGLRQIIEESESGKAKFNAAKYLSKGEWKNLSGRGRPSKEEVERELKVQTRLADSLDDDAERLGLTLVK